MKNSCLILMAHGSRNPGWGRPFEALLRELRRDVAEESVHLAYLENDRPLLSDVLREATAAGATRFRILPLLMSSGNHVAEDIPAQAAQLRRQYPDVSIQVLRPIGSHPRFMALLLELVKETLAG